MAVRRPARFLAPLALLVCAAAVLVVIQQTLREDTSSPTTPNHVVTGSTSTSTSPRSRHKTYTVRSGDTLGAISQRTGVSVDRLQQLNPKVDPQSLRTGQKLRLRR
jgi:LysM repeat protein